MTLMFDDGSAAVLSDPSRAVFRWSSCSLAQIPGDRSTPGAHRRQSRWPQDSQISQDVDHAPWLVSDHTIAVMLTNITMVIIISHKYLVMVILPLLALLTLMINVSAYL